MSKKKKMKPTNNVIPFDPERLHRRMPAVDLQSLAMTIAAANCRAYMLDPERQDYVSREDLKIGLGQVKAHFRARGVRFTKAGQILFPAAALGAVDLEKLLERALTEQVVFFNHLEDLGLSSLDGYFYSVWDLGWRHGVMHTPSNSRGDHCIVPVVVDLDLTTGTIGSTSFAGRVVKRDSALPVLERLFAEQQPELWAKLRGKKTGNS